MCKKKSPLSYCKSFLRRLIQQYIHSLHEIQLPSCISNLTSVYYMKLPVYIDFALYICVYTSKTTKKKRHFLCSKVYLLFVYCTTETKEKNGKKTEVKKKISLKAINIILKVWLGCDCERVQICLMYSLILYEIGEKK